MASIPPSEVDEDRLEDGFTGGSHGVVLYSNNCMSCHGPLESSEKRGRTALEIRTAIDSVSEMNTLASLSHEEVHAIAMALKTSTESAPVSGLRRLTIYELDNVLADLLLDDTKPAQKILPTDLRSPFDNERSLQEPSVPLIDGLEALSIDVTQRFVSDSIRYQTIVGCTPTSVTDENCMRSFVERFVRRALRRPITPEQVTKFAEFGLKQAALDGHFKDGVAIIVRAVIMHPEFIYRKEQGEWLKENIYRLSDIELASRLSFFLTGSMPDEQLLNAAENGQLSTADGLVSSAKRLLATDRARQHIERFHAQWIGFEHLPVEEPLNSAMREETANLLEQVIFNDNSAWTDILLSPKTYIDDNLAEHYGLPKNGEPGKHWVDYGNSGRRGLLSHGSFLAVGAKFGDTSPVVRGKLISERLLCKPVPPPPSDVNADVPPSGTEAQKCKEDRYIAHSQQSSSCFACHQQLDPIGFGLEQYNQLGAFRTAEPDKPECTIDGEGELPGIAPFSGPGELAELMVETGAPQSCLVQNLFVYAMGSKVTSSQSQLLSKLNGQFKVNGYRLKDYLVSFVTSEEFRLRAEDH